MCRFVDSTPVMHVFIVNTVEHGYIERRDLKVA